MYNRLPEDEPSGSKHVEGIKKFEIKIFIKKCGFCWFILCNCITVHSAKHINKNKTVSVYIRRYFLLLPLALQPTVGFGLSNNVLPFCPICHQLFPFSHSQHLKISFYFLFPSFPGSSPSSRPSQFLSEDLFGHPIRLHSL